MNSKKTIDRILELIVKEYNLRSSDAINFSTIYKILIDKTVPRTNKINIRLVECYKENEIEYIVFSFAHEELFENGNFKDYHVRYSIDKRNVQTVKIVEPMQKREWIEVNENNKVGVFIGRMQPPTVEHIRIIRDALKKYDFLYIMLGSCGRGRNIRNPFKASERISMIKDAIPEKFSLCNNSNVKFCELVDNPSDLAWRNQVEKFITHPDDQVTLIGGTKDESSFYLKMFPQWGFEEVLINLNISSTNVREKFFTSSYEEWVSWQESDMINFSTRLFLKKFRFNDYPLAFQSLAKEWECIDQYKKLWNDAPFEPVFVTVDNIVESEGKILIIKRKDYPGKGLFALPGGFINPHERLEASSLRELNEETGLTVEQLKPNDVKPFVVDSPYRSSRGRTISHVFCYTADDTPEVVGGDDASVATWVDIDLITSKDSYAEKFFDDHYDIILHYKNKKETRTIWG